VLRYLVPVSGTGVAGALAWVRQQFGPLSFAALFLLFSGLVRYWLFHLPGGRYASSLPAHLVPSERNAERLAEWARAASVYERLREGSSRRRIDRALDAEKRRELDERLARMREGFVAADAAATREAERAAESIALPAQAGGKAREAIGFLVTVAVAVGVVLAFRARVAEPYAVKGTSMLPTLEDEDVVLGNKLAYVSPAHRGPARGDVIVFRSSAVDFGSVLVEGMPDVLVKRVIGLPGDRIEMRGNNPVINGWTVPGCVVEGLYFHLARGGSGETFRGQLRVEFLGDEAYLTLRAGNTPPFPDAYVVQPGEVFVLGDNRGNSLDSRAFRGGSGGGVPFDAVLARAEWFLAGTHRSGDVDLGRLLRPLDALQHRLLLEGLDTKALDAGVLRCLQDPPKHTRPPPPEEASPSVDRRP
jgi:signal peptidase I